MSVFGERTLVDDRLNKYLEDEQKGDSDPETKRALTDWVNKRVEKSSFGDRIARDLARADLKIQAWRIYRAVCHCHSGCSLARLSGRGQACPFCFDWCRNRRYPCPGFMFEGRNRSGWSILMINCPICSTWL